MKTNRLLYVGLFAVILPLTSCFEKENEPQPLDQPTVPDAEVCEVGISPDIEELSADDAVTVANIFNMQAVKSRSASVPLVKDVKAVEGEDGTPALYAVNFTDGYVLISATKKSAPIQAVVEHGYFEPGKEVAGQDIVVSDMIKEKTLARMHEADSAIVKAWQRFEKSGIEPRLMRSRAISDELYYAQDAYVAKLLREGYKVYYLKNAASEPEIPSDVYNKFLATAKSEDFWEGTEDNAINAGLIAVRNETGYFSAPKMTTTWGQDKPYNSAAPTGEKLGCTTVALAQLMRYYEYPTWFQWSEMPNSLASTDVLSKALSDFLFRIRTDIGVKANGGASIEDVKRTLTQYGYEYTTSLPSVVTKPTYTRGENSSHTVGHAWIIDGTDKLVIQREYILHLPSHRYYPDFVFEETERIKGDVTSSTIYHYMNWGWEGQHNGWYKDYSLTHKYNEYIIQDFRSNRKYLTIKTPY